VKPSGGVFGDLSSAKSGAATKASRIGRQVNFMAGSSKEKASGGNRFNMPES
jgi:hypothetical protein